MESLIGPAFTALNAILGPPVTQLFKDVINKDENLQILNTDFKRMVNLLLEISTLFQHKEPPQTVKLWFQELLKSLTEANKILDHPSGLRRCLGCLICKPVRRAWKIREWTVNFDKLFQGLQNDFSTIVNCQKIAKSTPQKALPQSVPAAGFVGSDLKSGQGQIQTWLTETENVCVIRVCGMPGVGKTSILKMVYNHYLEVDSDAFQHLIWVTVSTVYNPLDLQARIAKEINFDLPHGSDIDTHKMLSVHLKEKKFLLVLDDVWHPLDLQELGVAFGEGKQSKVLFSTRRRDLILGTMSSEKSIEIQPLSEDEAWKLFRRIAFNDDTVSVSMEIVDCARKIAEECKGLPLAITVIAASMIDKTRADQWKISFDLMKTADPYFPKTHERVDPELYKRLRYSYDALPSLEVKNCFLYCAMYPEDYDIPVDELVQMWISEGLVGRERESHLLDMDVGRRHVDILVDRYLFQNAGYEVFDCPWSFVKPQKIRVHDVIRDMAIYIGEKDENCVFKTGQQLQNFPEIPGDCKRISLFDCDIKNLPTEFTSPKLASLLLCSNQIEVLPSGFLVSLTSLKVLDLSATSHSTLRGSMIPWSVGQLKQLEFLRLNNFSWMAHLPVELCRLSSLQFLDLSHCGLRSLPSQIGQLKTLKYLNLSYCEWLTVIPHEISQLTSLSTLNTFESPVHFNVEADSEASMWSLKGLVNLAMLTVNVRVDEQEGMTSPGIKVGIMGTWLEMRHLCLRFDLHFHSNRGHVVYVVLPEDMQKMSKLQSFHMSGYNGLSLPDYICNFQQLEHLELAGCDHLTGLSPLERLPKLKYLELCWCYELKELGIWSGFLMLEELKLIRLDRLESIAGASNKGVWNELILPNFRVLDINDCLYLKRFPNGMEKLVRLSSIIGSETWWQRIEWQDDNMRSHLQNYFKDNGTWWE